MISKGQVWTHKIGLALKILEVDVKKVVYVWLDDDNKGLADVEGFEEILKNAAYQLDEVSQVKQIIARYE